MIITDIDVGVGVTKNIGNYESVRLDYGYRVRIEPGESVKDVRQRTLAHLKEEVFKDAEKITL